MNMNSKHQLIMIRLFIIFINVSLLVNNDWCTEQKMPVAFTGGVGCVCVSV